MQPVVDRNKGSPATRLSHGSPGALEAAGVLGAACQPGNAGREDPCRRYP